MTATFPSLPHPFNRESYERTVAYLATVPPETVARVRAEVAADPRFGPDRTDEQDRLVAYGLLKIGTDALDIMRRTGGTGGNAMATLANPRVHPKVLAAIDREAALTTDRRGRGTRWTWLVARMAVHGTVAPAALNRLERVASIAQGPEESDRWRDAAEAQVWIDGLRASPTFTADQLRAWVPGTEFYRPSTASPHPHPWEHSLGSAILAHPASDQALALAIARVPILSGATLAALAASATARCLPQVAERLGERADAMPLLRAYLALDHEGEAFWSDLVFLMTHPEADVRPLAAAVVAHPDCLGVRTLDPTVLQILFEHDDTALRLATLTALAQRGDSPVVLGPVSRRVL